MIKQSAVALLVSAFGLLGVVSAPAAQADPAPRFRLAIDHHAVRSGSRLSVTVTATTECTWLLEWGGDRRVDRSAGVVTGFVAPVVTRPTRVALHATCFYAGSRPAGRSGAGTLVAFVPPSWRQDRVVTVLPTGMVVSPPHAVGGPGQPGHLPGTGGPALLVVLGALGALAAGSVLVRRFRTGVVTA